MSIKTVALNGVSPRAIFYSPTTGGISQLGVRVNYSPEDDAGQAAQPAEVDTAAALAAEFGQTPAPAPDGDAETPPGDDAAAATDEPAPKPKKTVQERIDELTKARKDADALAEHRARDVEYWKAKALQGDPKPQAEPKPAATTEDAPPNPEEYVYGAADEQYIADLVQHGVRQGFKAFQDQQTKTTEAQQVLTTHAERETAAKARYPDFDKVVTEGAQNATWPCTAEMAQAIRTSEVGPDVAYHLGSNPDEARRIAALDAHAQVREIDRLSGRIEARLETPAPAKTAKTATEAPEPPPTVRGQGGRFKAAPDTDDFAAFDAAYP